MIIIQNMNNSNEIDQYHNRNTAGLLKSASKDDMAKIQSESRDGASSTSCNISCKSNDRTTNNKTTDKITMLSIDFEPSPYHVICARGSTAKNWQANRFLRSLVDSAIPQYQKATSRMEKTVIVTEIIDAVRRQTDDGISFVKKVDGRWHQICDSLSREKVGQLLRERLHGMYKSSTKAKRRKQKQLSDTANGRINEAVRSSPIMASSISHLSESLALLPLGRTSDSDSNFETALTKANLEILGRLNTENLAAVHDDDDNEYAQGEPQPMECKCSSDQPESMQEQEQRQQQGDGVFDDNPYDFIPEHFPLLEDSEQENSNMFPRHSLY
jgi:hypothetical protein